ncbi:homeobox protein NANOG [Poecilia reticulata]|uniref:Homeobox protein Nkx-2.2a-like n=1 Tax=Poecilia reticulata TaxID=8081 RepID=A0A3P9PWI7_POERE|nr:PREDICTED: homeobox protein Nkx-2.2a-like [Poecilia reticulata]
MAEWKTQVTYNYNPSYHTYAYSLVYQSVAEQNDGNLPAWDENGEPDYNDGAQQNVCTAVAPIATVNESESPLRNPGTVTGSYQSSELMYVDGTQAEPTAEAYGDGESEVNRARKNSVSDSESHTSPDSWSSVSSREGSLPKVAPTTWVENAVKEEPVVRTVDGSEDVSSSLMEDSRNLATLGNGASDNSAPAPLPSPKTSCTNPAANPKVKVRAAFTERQMNALVQRFSVQRYLTPAEMKNLADMTGLSYKQVKTWFQNRRMKLRRHQKDTSWVSERYAVHKDASTHRPAMPNMAPHIPPYQGDGRPQFRENYNQHAMETAFKKTPPNMSYYLAAVGGTAGSSGFSQWPANTSQAPVPNQPDNDRWPVPQGGGPFDYSSNTFNSTNYMHAAHFESKEGEAVNSPLNPAVMHHGNQ